MFFYYFVAFLRFLNFLLLLFERFYNWSWPYVMAEIQLI